MEKLLKNAQFELLQCQYFDAASIPKIGQRMLLVRAQKCSWLRYIQAMKSLMAF